MVRTRGLGSESAERPVLDDKGGVGVLLSPVGSRDINPAAAGDGLAVEEHLEHLTIGGSAGANDLQRAGKLLLVRDRINLLVVFDPRFNQGSRNNQKRQDCGSAE